MSVSFCSVALLTACADFQRSIVSHLRELMAAMSADNTVVLTEDDVPGPSLHPPYDKHYNTASSMLASS